MPQRANSSGLEIQSLGGINVTIDCPLRFGNLRNEWDVVWTALDSHNNRLPPSGYVIQRNAKFQLVIRSASNVYDRARFQCIAIRESSASESSQFVTFYLIRK